MPRAPVVEIWRSEVKPYSPRTPSSPPELTTPTSTPTKTGSKSKSEFKSRSKVKVETEFESPKSPKSHSPSGRGQPWTPAEKLKLYAIVIKQGANMKHFEGQIEGRTAHQCYMAWSYVILSFNAFMLGD
jgi:hypothetical protein